MPQPNTPDTPVSRFVAVAQSCIQASAQDPNASEHWRLFDELLVSFNDVAEQDALPLIEQIMNEGAMRFVARTLARRATERFAHNARAWYLYGRTALIISSDSPEAGPALERAWSIDPDADLLLPLCRAAAFVAGKQYPEAEAACHEMLRRAPDSADAYSNLAIAMRGQFRTNESIAAAEAALKIDPAHEHAPLNLALSLVDAWRFDDALTLLRHTIAQRPDDDRIRLPLGELELRLGIWQSGWSNMHARFSLPGLREQLRAREQECGVPHWRGEPLEGRTLGVWLEQGYGDSILLIRFLPLMAERVRALGGKLVFGCFGPLVELFRPLIPADVELNVDFLKQTDFHTPLMSLCAPFGFGNDTLPGEAYLGADDADVAQWRKRLGVGDGRLHIALTWTGNPQQTRNDIRSLPLAQLEELLATENVVFHSVNPAASALVATLRDKGFNVIDWGPELKDFITTAALLQAADGVVTTCTSIAHLAGAVGAPTLLMLDRVASFIWGAEHERTAWYDSIRIVRQAHYGDWSDVVARTREALTVQAKAASTRSK
ncbi:tetratricopeptide repeat protein [Uliginosibacterium sp. sgz301328]|uniref:tetratricopeptide repeat protein n=1 Tax=Uliginosibacterium sp. sgz301328 TaxID=3243764 RepID=UPI00359E2C28